MPDCGHTVVPEFWTSHTSSVLAGFESATLQSISDARALEGSVLS